MPQIDNRMTKDQFEQFKKHANNIIQLLLENEMNKHTIEGIRLSWDAKPFDEENLSDRRKNDRKHEFLAAVAGFVAEWIKDGKEPERGFREE